MCKTYFIEEICETICVKNTFSCCVTFSIKFVYHVKTGCLKRSSCFQVIKCRNLNSNNIQNFTGKSSHFIIYCSMHVCPPLLLCVGGLDGLCTCVCVTNICSHYGSSPSFCGIKQTFGLLKVSRLFWDDDYFCVKVRMTDG